MKRFTVEEGMLFVRLSPIVSLLAIVLIGSVSCGGGSKAQVAPTVSPPPPAVAPIPNAPTPASSSEGSAGIEGTIIEVVNKDLGGSGVYEFAPANITVVAGETVMFSLVAETEFHTFTVSDLDIEVEIEAGQTESFTFTFDNPGTYDLVCTVHELKGMVGTITVQ